MLSALFIHGIPIECINQAAVTYYVPATVIISVINSEGGKVGMAKHDANGTYDLGPMQINSVWVSKVSHYGYTFKKLQFDPCANVMVGTWILSQRIANGNTIWDGIGDYHSYSPTQNSYYQNKVLRNYQHLKDLLNAKPVTENTFA